MLRLAGCDRDCGTCAIIGICGGREAYELESRGYRCPFLGCELETPAMIKMHECSLCRLGRITWDLSPQEVSDLVSQVVDIEELRARPIELPKVVPMISLRNPSSFCWDSLDIGAVIIGFEELFDAGLLRSVSQAGDIHSYLNFEGNILLSSIMPDEFLTEPSVFHYFMKMIKQGGFDGAIAWDSPAYADIPLYDAWINLMKGLLLTHELIEDEIPVIGLVKGNAERQIEFSTRILAKSGIKSMALHASEYMPRIKMDGAARQILYTYFRHMRKLADSVLLIGVMKPSSLAFVRQTFFEPPKLSVAGFSWHLDAEAGILYSNRGNIDATSKFVECRCHICTSTGPKGLMASLGAKTKHNLSYLANLSSGTLSPDVQTYDLILDRSERALFVSDIYLWTGRALLDDLMAFLRDEKPPYVVFLGNTFDLESGTPDLAEAGILLKVLREIGASVLVVKGCSDGNQEQLLSALDTLTMGGKPKPILWNKRNDEALQQTILDIYRFYRSAKESLVIKLANGEVVIAEHGHRIVRDPTKITDVEMDKMEDARREANASWLIMGHLLRAFIDKDKCVASTGCWTLGGPQEWIQVKKEDIGTSIVLTGDGRIEIKRRG